MWAWLFRPFMHPTIGCYPPQKLRIALFWCKTLKKGFNRGRCNFWSLISFSFFFFFFKKRTLFNQYQMLHWFSRLGTCNRNLRAPHIRGFIWHLNKHWSIRQIHIWNKMGILIGTKMNDKVSITSNLWKQGK